MENGRGAYDLKVFLLRHTPEPELVVARAARTCYSRVSGTDLLSDMKPGEVERLIRMLWERGHLSVFEHASFTFSVSGVSRALSHQLVRHRIASYSQQSQRYVNERNFEHVVPPTVMRNQDALRRFEELMGEIQASYEYMVKLGIPREDARYVLPNACETSIIVTFNARSLHNFFRLRCCFRAQWEIRRLAYRMLSQVKKVAPVLFEKAGPPCVSEGVCHEGANSCGRIKRIGKSVW